VPQIVQKAYPGPTYPASRLAQDFRTVARLIAGGMETRVYYVNHGGYDTHVNQKQAHHRLLKEWSDALAAFMADMRRQGNEQRVTVMVFGEFGRRVAENSGGGTDHGTAAPLFIAGGGVRAGIFGDHPDLSPAKLDRGDLRHSLDFRAVYAALLRDKLKADPVAILGRSWKTPALFS